MSKHVLFYGWNRAIPGREKEAGALFQEYLQYLGRIQGEGLIDSFETIILSAHGGDLNGFFLIRGDQTKLQALRRTEEFEVFMTKGGLYIDGGGLITGVTGAGVMESMVRWTSLIPE
jgi:hypothetical protein